MTASGILVEGVLESMAEYYSAELFQKIRWGMDINAEKCLSNDSNPGLGYRVDEERRFHVDSEGASVVREIFERYASGETVAEIVQSLNTRQIKISLGKVFNKNEYALSVAEPVVYCLLHLQMGGNPKWDALDFG